MPKQRGGWKGAPKPGMAAKFASGRRAAAAVKASSAENDDMFDEVDRFHGLNALDDTRAGDVDAAEWEDDEEPVFDLQQGDSDAASTSEEEEDSEAEDSDAEERTAAIRKEDRLLTAWGKKRSAFYQNDAEAEVDEEAAAAEEEEAIRLQRMRAAAVDDEDLAFGLPTGDNAEEEEEEPSLGQQAAGRTRKSAASLDAAARGNASTGVERLTKDLSTLSRKAKLDIVLADTPELLGLLDELKAKVAEIRRSLEPIMAAVKEGRVKTQRGLSYLEVKHQLLLSYIINITFYLLLKAEGKPVRNHPVIDAIVHIRTLLDKMRPLDAKMANQVARLLKAAQEPTGTGVEVLAEEYDSDMETSRPRKARMSAADAGGASARPNPAALLQHGDSALAESDAADAGKSKRKGGDKSAREATRRAHVGADMLDDDDIEMPEDDGVYRPIRRTAMPYDDDPKAAKAARQEERKRQRIAKSSMLADLKSAYADAPMEEDVDGGAMEGMRGRTALDDRLDRVAAERRSFEEDAFTRVQMSKEERKARKARERERARWDNLAELEHFGDIDALLAEDGAAGLVAGGAKKKGSRSLADLEAAIAETKNRGMKGVAAAAAATSAGSGAAASRSGFKRGRMEEDEDVDEEDMYEGGKSRGGRGRAGRGGDDSDDGEGDAFYNAVAAAAAAKKARRAEFNAARDEEGRAAIRDAREVDALADPSGHRKASKQILQNRGLVKYRKREDANPRVAYRRKAEAAVKRRKGQVVPMRDTGAEAGAYAGESTGIRTRVIHSRTIRS